MVSQPVKAVILLFPISEGLEGKRKEEERKIATEGQHPIDPTVVWIKQTVRTYGASWRYFSLRKYRNKQIPNACGTIGLLHALMNVS